MKRYFSAFIKIVISVAALYYVAGKIDLEETAALFKTIEIGWLLLAILFFIISKILSSIRLWAFFISTGLSIDPKYNLRLYWIGMFYNLFLPGGIGGDGYKIYLLRKQHTVSTKQLVQATVLDRINGLFALILLALGLVFFLPPVLEYQDLYAIILGIISIPSFWLFNRIFFKAFLDKWLWASFLSLGVQVAQLICAWFILLSLGIYAKTLVYQFVFLISSIVAVLPFTIGGIGARELTFVMSHDYLGINQNSAVAFSLLFFLITAASSLPGILLKEKQH